MLAMVISIAFSVVRQGPEFCFYATAASDAFIILMKLLGYGGRRTVSTNRMVSLFIVGKGDATDMVKKHSDESGYPWTIRVCLFIYVSFNLVSAVWYGGLFVTLPYTKGAKKPVLEAAPQGSLAESVQA